MDCRDKPTSLDESYPPTTREQLRQIRQEKGFSLMEMAKLLMKH